MKKVVSLVFVVTVAIFGPLLLNAAEAATKPLLMENKKALFQRMLAIPSAALYAHAGGEVTGKPVPFSVYYIYARQQVNGKDWLQVGSDSHGSIKGWMLATDLIMWNQGLTVAFRKPGETDRVLLFRDRESLKS
jgi:hypothetical protein